MAATKCQKCDLVMNRQGESRPSIICKRCKNEYCNKCAKETEDICKMMKAMGKPFWTCGDCEAQDADMKAVVDSVKLMKKGQEEQKAELRAIKKGQEEQRMERAEQQAERKKVLEGLKAVEAVAKKLEEIETKQEKHDERLNQHEDVLEKNSRRHEEGEIRIKKLEERMEKGEKENHDGNTRQFNSIVQEVREIEKREKNIIVFNVPEMTAGEEEEDSTESNLGKIKEILKELGCEEIQPANAVRIGKSGKYPRQILTVLPTVEACEKIVKKSRDGPKLSNDVFITRDRTFKQRQEAKIFRMEKEKEERDGDASQSGRGRGGRGRGRPRGGGGRGRGFQSRNDSVSGSRKRRNSGEAEENRETEDEAKRMRTGGGGGARGAVRRGGGGGGEAAAGGAAGVAAVTDVCTPGRVAPTSDPPVAPQSVPDSQLGAVGGEVNF